MSVLRSGLILTDDYKRQKYRLASSQHDDDDAGYIIMIYHKSYAVGNRSTKRNWNGNIA